MALDSAANVVQALGRVDEGPLEATLDANVHVTGVPQSDAVFSTSKTAHDLKDRLLHFLSTASNETLGACLVGLGASTYLVLGRLGLVLIGVAGGIVLHATWEGNTQVGAEDEVTGVGIRKRREGGLDIVERVLDWRDSKNGAQSKDEDGGQDVEFMISTRKELDFAAFQPATGAALTSLVNAVIRDYVKYVATLHNLIIQRRQRLTCVDGGMDLFCPPKPLSHSPVVKLLSDFSWRSPRIYPARDQLTPSWTF